jgi:tetratricopeptide (TPR) repeat protein
MADRTEIISKFLNGELSGSKLADFKSQLASDRKLFEEYLLQKDLCELMTFVFTDEVVDKELKNPDLNCEIDDMISEWEKNKNSKEYIETRLMLNKLMNEYTKKREEEEFELMDLELENKDIDDEIEQMINFSNDNKTNEIKYKIQKAFEDYDKELQSKSGIPPIEIKQRKNLKLTCLSIAAISLLLITLGLMFFNIGETKTNDEIISQYYSTPYSTFKVRNVDSLETNLTSALDYYDKLEFNKSAELLQLLISENKNDTTAYFYLAMSYFELKKYEFAEKYLLQLQEMYNPENMNISWYLGFCYLAQNKNKNAINEFKKLQKSDSFGIRVKEILKAID